MVNSGSVAITNAAWTDIAAGHVAETPESSFELFRSNVGYATRDENGTAPFQPAPFMSNKFFT